MELWDVLWVSSHNELSMVFILEIMVLYARKEEQSGFSRFQHKLDMRTKTNTDVSKWANVRQLAINADKLPLVNLLANEAHSVTR